MSLCNDKKIEDNYWATGYGLDKVAYYGQWGGSEILLTIMSMYCDNADN